MALARQAVSLSKGRPRAAVQAAAESVAERLASMVQPFAESVFARHRAAGRPLVLATTTPYDLVKPFADRIGLDDVVATRWTVNADGTYDGTLAGPFVWSSGKLTAVREWAENNDIDLEESYAYSDSAYDVPLLSAVAYPIVVNPDPRMSVIARARRWPVLNLDVSPGVVKIPFVGLELQRVAMQFTRPSLVPYARFEFEGVENVPVAGAAILVANHRSYFDSLAISMLIAKTGRTVRFLGGEMVTLMPQGTIPRGPAFFDPVLKGRWGAARLALLSGAPVIPVGLWGTEKVWPRSSRLPNVLNLTDPPVVRISVGKAVELKHRSLDADTKRIMAAIRRQLPPEAAVAHKPTEEELRLTYPPGYKGDPDREVERRPGTD